MHNPTAVPDTGDAAEALLAIGTRLLASKCPHFLGFQTSVGVFLFGLVFTKSASICSTICRSQNPHGGSSVAGVPVSIAQRERSTGRAGALALPPPPRAYHERQTFALATLQGGMCEAGSGVG